MPNTTLKKRKRSSPADPTQTSIYAYFSQEKSEKRRKALSSITNQLREANKSPAPTVISYRDDNWGGGAYYDHYTMQLITNNPTLIAPTKEDESVERSLTHLIFHLQNHVTHNLMFGQLDEKSKRTVPEIIEQFDTNHGLLVFPGIARSSYEKRTEEYNQRITAQSKLFKRALLIGQPILGICGGSWYLWEYFGGVTKEAKGHSCRAGMPRIKDTTGKIGHNIQVHRIIIQENALLLKAALHLTSEQSEYLPVNSVHWRAPDLKQIPIFYQVSALPKRDDNLAPKKSKGTIMQPDEDCIEGFEAKFGAPILGVLWHPEAYTNNTDGRFYPTNQQYLLKYMVQAGQAFKNRRVFIKQFSEICKDEKSFTQFKDKRLKKTGLIANNFLVVKETQHEKKSKLEQELTIKSLMRFKIFTLNKLDQYRHIEEAKNEIKIKQSYLAEKSHHPDHNLATYYGYFRVSASPVKLKLKKESSFQTQPKVEHEQKRFIYQSTPFWDNAKEMIQEPSSREVREPLHKQDQVKQWLNAITPAEFDVGIAMSKGDCFFDAIAQGLNQRSGEVKYSTKSLRAFCDTYAKDKNNTWVEKANIKDRQDHEQYLVSIQFTAQEMEDLENQGVRLGTSLWGRQNIEGRMFCEAFGIVLHVIEIQRDGSINRFLFDSRGQTERYNPIIDYDDPNILHIVNHHNHYVPLLKSHQHKSELIHGR